MFVQCVGDFVLGAQPDKAFSFFTVFENNHRRYAEDLEFLSGNWVLIDIEFADYHFAVILFRQLHDGWR